MRSKRPRKLALSRESLVHLTRFESVAGGDIPPPTETCQTCKFCPLQTYDLICMSKRNACFEA